MMTGVAGKTGSMWAMKTTSPIRAVGRTDEPAAVRNVSAVHSSRGHSAVAPSQVSYGDRLVGVKLCRRGGRARP